jgi:hypothetical protein
VRPCRQPGGSRESTQETRECDAARDALMGCQVEREWGCGELVISTHHAGRGCIPFFTMSIYSLRRKIGVLFTWGNILKRDIVGHRFHKCNPEHNLSIE